MKRAALVIACAGALSCFSTTSIGGGDVDTAIRGRIALLQEAWNKGDAAAVTAQVYGKDVTIAGEGQAQAVRGAQAVDGLVRDLVKSSKSVSLRVEDLKPIGSSAAYTWVTWTIVPRAEAEKPFSVRSLFVWTKGKEGWRIRADMYSLGQM